MSRKPVHNAGFKAKVALTALKESQTISQLASQFQLHPNQIYKWKRQLLDGAASLFESGRSPSGTTTTDVEVAGLYEQIGRLNMELEWLKQKLPTPVEALRALIDWEHESLSVRRQCQLLGGHARPFITSRSPSAKRTWP